MTFAAPELTKYKPRARRTKNFWEPIYDPSEVECFPLCDWNFQHNGGPRHMTLCSSGMSRENTKFENLRFEKCDFSGDFEIGPREIVFKNCTFTGCDFGLSIWKNTKFRGCSFILCSLTQTKWHKCEFRDCNWHKIGISGNETEFVDTLVNNPEKFIAFACTNTDEAVLEKANVRKLYQIMRLESTKSTVARKLARDFLNFGDEKTYYKAVKISTIQSIKAKIYEHWFSLLHGKTAKDRIFGAFGLLMSISESFILQLIGFINAWGGSVARPSFIGMLIVLCFTILYLISGVSGSFSCALIKSIEITLLIGYTNHSPENLSLSSHFLVLSNMVMGLLWYVVIIPTLVNRVSRVR